jgi:hypothetical protein
VQHRCIPLSVVDPAICHNSGARNNRSVRMIVHFDDKAEGLVIIASDVVIGAHFHWFSIKIW